MRGLSGIIRGFTKETVDICMPKWRVEYSTYSSSKVSSRVRVSGVSVSSSFDSDTKLERRNTEMIIHGSFMKYSNLILREMLYNTNGTGGVK